jgi:cytochrome c-type biogenesis protein
MADLLFGATLLTAFLGGLVALLAPCCVSVMLPAYLATGLARRCGVLAATLVFGGGVATIIVPVGLGATAISATILGHHLLVYSVGGVAMIVAGLATMLGLTPRLPMPARPAGTLGQGIVGVYALGAFSGTASACCAPVLAGIAVLSGVTASFVTALAVSLTYVLGMVAPLLVFALAWDRHKDRAGQLLRGHNVRVGLGARGRTVSVGSVLAGLVLVAMGALTVVLAITGPSMPTSGWRVTLAANLQHTAAVTTRALSWLPGWLVAAALLIGFTALVRQAGRTATPTASPADSAGSPNHPDGPVTLEHTSDER